MGRDFKLGTRFGSTQYEFQKNKKQESASFPKLILEEKSSEKAHDCGKENHSIFVFCTGGKPEEGYGEETKIVFL